MGKRGIINPTFGKTDAAFWGGFRSLLRKHWRHSQQYRDALARAKHSHPDATGRRKFCIRCEACETPYNLGERVIIGQTKGGKDKDALAYQIDHIEDAGSLKSFEDFSGFVERLFCPPEGLKILCYFCHKEKTHG